MANYYVTNYGSTSGLFLQSVCSWKGGFALTEDKVIINVSTLLRAVPNVTGKIFDLPCT